MYNVRHSDLTPSELVDIVQLYEIPPRTIVLEENIEAHILTEFYTTHNLTTVDRGCFNEDYIIEKGLAEYVPRQLSSGRTLYFTSHHRRIYAE